MDSAVLVKAAVPCKPAPTLCKHGANNPVKREAMSRTDR
jgi:hypothetical protein